MRSRFVCLLAGVLAIAGMSLPLPAQVYSNLSLNGAYAMVFDGTAPGPGAERVPFAGIQRLIFDGEGNFTGEAIVAQPGPTGTDVVRSEVVGTYSVNPDGTFEVEQERFLADTSQSVKLSDESFHGTIFEAGQQFRAILTSFERPGVGSLRVMVSGEAWRQSGESFSTQTLRGNYSQAIEGTAFTPAPTLARFLGTFFFDGEGLSHVLSPNTQNTSGEVEILPALPPPFEAGTYTVDERGFANLSFDLQAPPGTKIGETEFVCVIADRGETLPCVVTRNARFFDGVLVDIPTVAIGDLELMSRADQ